MKRCTGVLIAAWLLSMSATVQRADAATPYLQVLPDDAAARAALAGAPQMQVAQQEREYTEAIAKRQADGAHEWIISSTVQRRELTTGLNYREEDLSVSRAFRWLGKADLDRSMGNRIMATAESAFADAWHEASRSLLSQWFDWLRATSEANLLSEQQELFRSQVAATEQRVAAGDAPRLELQLAHAELERAQVAELRARQNADLLKLELHNAFPLLEVRLPAAFDMPVESEQKDEYWIEQIIDHNHEIELSEGQAEVAKLAAQRAQRDRIADPSLGVRYGREFDAQERIVGLTFSMPLPGAARQNAYVAAQAEARRAAKAADQTKLGVERDARADLLALRSNFTQWRLLASLAQRSKDNAATAARAYTLGEYGLSETLAARRQATESAVAAQLAHLNALQAQARLWLDAHQLWQLDDHPR